MGGMLLKKLSPNKLTQANCKTEVVAITKLSGTAGYHLGRTWET